MLDGTPPVQPAFGEQCRDAIEAGGVHDVSPARTQSDDERPVIRVR
jgi:hypothetical protein